MTRETDRLYAPIKRPGNGMATCIITPANEPACVLSVMAGEIRDLGDMAEEQAGGEE